MTGTENYNFEMSFRPLMVGMVLLPFLISMSQAEEASYSYNNFGGIGLLEMRTARFAPDGTIAVGVHYNNQSTRYFSTWQATPWLETTLSYSDDKSDSLGVDRSLDVKIRLLSEGNYRPQVAIGIQDALGSGRYAAEYIAASKRYYDFDFTMGFSWGYLGSRQGMGNMFRLFGNSFDTRSTSTSSGGIRTGSYFTGKDMAFFAGAEYYPPISGLSFKVEYSGVDTTKIPELSHLKRKTAFNFGVNYQPRSWANIAFGFDQGDRFSVRLTLKQNLHSLKLTHWVKGPEPVAILERNKPQSEGERGPLVISSVTENDKLFDRQRRLGAKVIAVEQGAGHVIIRLMRPEALEQSDMVLIGAVLESHNKATIYIGHNRSKLERFDVSRVSTVGRLAVEQFRKTAVYLRKKSGRDKELADFTSKVLKDNELAPLSVSLEKTTVVVRKKAGPFANESKNIGRVARVLTQTMPDNIEEFTVLSEVDGLETSHVSLLRQDFEKANSYQSSPEEIWANKNIKAPGAGQKPDAPHDVAGASRFDWGLKPELITHFGGNDDGRFRWDLYAKIFGAVWVTPQIKLSAELKQYIVGDIEKIPQDVRPNTPKVRSDIGRYAKEGRTAVERLQFDYRTQINSNFYAQISGGYLESMYGGIGAEILYRPYQENFAFGVDVNWVKQRGFDQLFSFRDYDILTGHATLYYENTTYNITSKLSAGRYLAGDYGATFDISRRFSNGVRIGVWATYTDMSSADFGDGSFDKGIYLTMPLELLWYRPTRETLRFNFRSLGKNGGQKLDRSRGLYDILSSGRKNRLSQEWQHILD